MSKPSQGDHARYLRDAEAQFRLMAAVRLACTLKTQPLTVPDLWTFGKKSVRGDEFRLHEDEAEHAAAVLERTVTHTLCLEAVQAIKDFVPNPRKSSSADTQAAFEISRLLRNAYAHQPFAPKWNIDPPCRDRVYEIKDVIRLKTESIDGCPVKWQDYGGLLALLHLSTWIRKHILKDPDADRLVESCDRVDVAENARIIQQGRMILQRIDAVPSDATVIRVGDEPIKIGEDAVEIDLAARQDSYPRNSGDAVPK